MRVGEVLGLRWNRVKGDRLVIVERVYDGEFDDVKTDAGHREVPFDQRGVIAEVMKRCRARNKFLGPEDLVFANRAGRPIDRHDLLNRQIKVTALKLGLPREIDFRSFRTMHCSLMLRTGARPGVTRDNMGHANIDVTQNVYCAYRKLRLIFSKVPLRHVTTLHLGIHYNLGCFPRTGCY